METATVRVSGIQAPAYLNGRSREMLTAAFRPTKRVAEVAPTNFATSLRDMGMRPGDGVPFAAMYMMRNKKKLALLHRAA